MAEKKAGLTLFWSVFQYAFYVRSEALVEHLIAFVEYADTQMLEYEVALAQMVECTAWRAYDDLGAVLERLSFGGKRVTTIKELKIHLMGFCQEADDACYLDS